MNKLGVGMGEGGRATGSKRERQEESKRSKSWSLHQPKADFCRSSHWRVQKPLVWAHTTAANVHKILTYNNTIIRLIKIPSFHWYFVKDFRKNTSGYLGDNSSVFYVLVKRK